MPGYEDRELREVLECGPFREIREQVVFPFLVLEAKKESGDSFDDVEIQTALAIKKLLDLQFRLNKATGEKTEWQSGPLVWFLSCRGEAWRVAAAVVEEKGRVIYFVGKPKEDGTASRPDADRVYSTSPNFGTATYVTETLRSNFC